MGLLVLDVLEDDDLETNNPGLQRANESAAVSANEKMTRTHGDGEGEAGDSHESELPTVRETNDGSNEKGDFARV